MLHQKYRTFVAVTKQSAAPSLDTLASKHSLARWRAVPEKEVKEHCKQLFGPFSEEMIDDDAALFRTSPTAETDAGRNPRVQTKSPSVQTDAGRPACLSEK